MSNVYSGGLGGSTGDELATYNNLVISPTNNVLYVHFATGTDAGSDAGRERQQPLKTYSQAYTNAIAGDIICLLSGHAETVTTTKTVNKAGLKIISEGNGVANQASFTTNADCGVFNVTAASVLIANINFPNALVATSHAKITMSGAGGQVRGCYFSLGATDAGSGIVVGADGCRIVDSTFLSTATSTASPSKHAIVTLVSTSDLTIDGITVDGGTVGWESGIGIDLLDVVTRMYAVNIDLLNGSDLETVSGSTYILNIRNRTGSSRLIVNE